MSFFHNNRLVLLDKNLVKLANHLLKNAPVAQLDRVPGFGPGGWGFEPLRVYFFCKFPPIFHTKFVNIVTNNSFNTLVGTKGLN